MKNLFILLLVLGAFQSALFAQDNNFWKTMNESAIGRDLFANRYKPADYRIFQLNAAAFKNDVAKAPSERTVDAAQSSFIVSIPNSEGQIEQFRVVDAPVMDPALAARYPQIRSYAGKGITDPGSSIRFDVSPRGFHGMILSVNRPTIYIDPVDNLNNYYVVFSREDVVNYKREFRCLTAEDAQRSLLPVNTGDLRAADDGRLRTYRLALACTGEYSQYFLNGTELNDAERKAKVLAAMNTLMVRTNGIYERDFGIRMNLIANNDAIIYLTPSTDPWTNEYNSKTQQTIDAVIGNANYDIGHLVHRGGNNGNAGCIGCVCKTGQKGSAFTSHTTPEGDPFVVDYSTHEMGHQFGANHTFTFSNESGTGSQFEPGSGSTIMGYAGITGPTDVQPHSDDYFHTRSIEQITNYIKLATGGAACAVVTITGNTAPTANAGADYTIPKATPFLLTAAGSDVDAGDVLTFTWEQVNAGTSSTTYPSTTATSGPLFRSITGTTSTTRSFPRLSSVLDGTNGYQWERLAGVARTLNFRLTVKDNHVAGGNAQTDDMAVIVSSAAGPFAVTVPNTAVTWGAGTPQNVTWSVAASNAAPVNCANVMISLSTDGGQTFPTVLLASTPNDGSQTITVPSVNSTTCRIKVEAVGNIFFDIGNANFTINGTPPACGDPTGLNAAAVTNTSATLNWSAVSGALSYDVDYKLNSSGTWINAATATAATSVGLSGLTQGSLYDWRVRATCSGGSGNYTTAQFTTTSPCDTVTGLGSSAITSTSATVSWSAMSGANNYDVDYKLSSSGTWINAVTATTSTSLGLTGLTAASTYDWRVRGNCTSGSGAYASAQFTTTATGCSDILEPNNTSGTAKPITPGTTYNALIAASGDNDYYSFSNTTALKKIKVTLTNLPFDYDMKLYRPNGGLAGTSQLNGTSPEKIIYNPTNNNNVGLYKVYVYGYSGAFSATQCYTLLVQLSATNWTSKGDGDEEESVVLKTGFKVFPSPARDIANLQFDATEKGSATITVMNQSGAIVMKQVVGTGAGINFTRLNVSKLTSGVYIVRVTQGNSSQSQQLVIAK